MPKFSYRASPVPRSTYVPAVPAKRSVKTLTTFNEFTFSRSQRFFQSRNLTDSRQHEVRSEFAKRLLVCSNRVVDLA